MKVVHCSFSHQNNQPFPLQEEKQPSVFFIFTLLRGIAMFTVSHTHIFLLHKVQIKPLSVAWPTETSSRQQIQCLQKKPRNIVKQKIGKGLSEPLMGAIACSADQEWV